MIFPFCFHRYRVETERIKEVGPEQAAAEWLIRNGAKVKWRTQNTWQVKYERDPNVPAGDFLEAIDGTDSAIMALGFDHLGERLYWMIN